ncbi:MAG: sugar phosphate nucleotidyltransferase [Thermoplasmatota archaeon]
MQAIVLAGGFGTRLAPLTYPRPKPLLPILGKPMIHHLMDQLPPETEIILATNYRTEQIQAYFDGIGRDITINEEPEPLGTGGATKYAEEYIDDTFLVLNSDIISSLDFQQFIDFHRAKEATATISLWPVDDVSAFGVADVQPDGRITNFVEKPRPEEAPSKLINAGAYCLEPEVLDRIPAGEMISMENDIFPELIEDGRPFYGYRFDGFWIDVGRPSSYIDANVTLLERKKLPYYVGPGSSVDGTLKKCSLGGNVSVALGATLERCVIYDDVEIGRDASLYNCIIGEGCHIGDRATIHNAVVGDGEDITAGMHVSDTAVWNRPKPDGYPNKQIGNPLRDD